MDFDIGNFHRQIQSLDVSQISDLVVTKNSNSNVRLYTYPRALLSTSPAIPRQMPLKSGSSLSHAVPVPIASFTFDRSTALLPDRVEHAIHQSQKIKKPTKIRNAKAIM